MIKELYTLLLILCCSLPLDAQHTEISIHYESFFINGKPTYEGRVWNGKKIEGLLMNSRMVQGIFDDLNSSTRHLFKYPDTGVWDPNRNTQEFIDAMDDWYNHGLLCIVLNMQGGNPKGYGKSMGWENSAYNPDGTLRNDYLARLKKIINKADDLGMIVMLGYFYFGADQLLNDENSVINATRNITEWILKNDYTNVIVEIANECNLPYYDHEILNEKRITELIELVKSINIDGKRLLVSTSYSGGNIPSEKVISTSDFVLLHGNGVDKPEKIKEMIRKTRDSDGYTPKPILINEDDHFDFQAPESNFTAAVDEYASWGYFDYRMEDEGYDEGFQSVPVNWKISSERKRVFFNKVKEITGGTNYKK